MSRRRVEPPIEVKRRTIGNSPAAIALVEALRRIRIPRREKAAS